MQSTAIKVISLAVYSILGIISTNAQQKILEADVRLKGNSSYAWLTKVIVQGDSTLLLILDNRQMFALSFDKNMKMVRRSENGALPLDTDDVIGVASKGNEFAAFFTNKKEDKFSISRFNPLSNKFEIKNNVLALGTDERYVNSIVNEHGLVVLVSTGVTSIRLNLLSIDGKIISHQYQFPSKDFLGDELDDIIGRHNTKSISGQSSFESAAKKVKLYASKDKVLVTIDEYMGRTAVLTMDISSNESKTDYYIQRPIDCESSITPRFNSFVFEGILYQINICPSAFALEIKDLSSAKTITSFQFTKNDEITFANTPIIQAGAVVTDGEGVRELSRSLQFLRKLSLSTPAVT